MQTISKATISSTTPPLLKMRSVVLGLFPKAVKSVIRTMNDRIAARGEFSSAEIADGLAEAVPVKSVASGRDANTGDRLLWVKTAVRIPLNREATAMVADALRDEQEERKG